jgi:hypothetical protein
VFVTVSQIHPTLSCAGKAEGMSIGCSRNKMSTWVYSSLCSKYQTRLKVAINYECASLLYHCKKFYGTFQRFVLTSISVQNFECKKEKLN